ncbi:ATP-binding protein [Streptomyces echinoruber]|uniref:ATP-binding protein n=1 Tax=Streptomyces echinoruber TaxID=68898 RepID=A0A918QRJ1_9ACTN|nr:ATP-binding protein [Streptomyces echinoruber]GGZ68041.1 ATP-binding protein [Streptomyces echinoruber]
MAIPLRQQASDGPDRDRRVALRWNATWDSGTVTAAEARAAVGDFLARVRASTRVPVPDHVAQDAHLVVSELVANVVRHAPGPCGLGLELPAAGDRLRISVWDTSPAPPRPRPPDGRRVGGHGLEIVQAISRTVTVAPWGRGKRITAELALPADGTPHPGGA